MNYERIILILLLSFLLTNFATCPLKYPAPIVEDCIIGEVEDQEILDSIPTEYHKYLAVDICIDERISNEVLIYPVQEKVNYRNTSPQDFATLELDRETLRIKLIKAERR